ncbi:MAG: DUF1343 domain-containing protein [Ignavibacteria bacterium]|nr:DUF1343 domain-containing protein [Ignavibacteria bacterium]
MTRFLLCVVVFLLFKYDFDYSKETNQAKVLLGIDVLIREDFRQLYGKRVGILTNSASRSSTKKMTVEYFANNPKFNLTAIFTPEHGFFTTIPAGKYVPDDSLYGVPIFSLYGNNRKPTPYQMSFVDVIVVDLQDIGVRSYTYISTLFKVMEACSEANIPIIVLDRPNPLGGNLVDGNVLEIDKTSFVGIIPIPYIHGCTIGEIALMINGEGWLKTNGTQRKCDLTVVKMEGWRREMKWEDTGLQWFQTSPNVRSVDAIRGLAMFGVLGELRLFNLGVGTEHAFQIFVVPNVSHKKLDNLMKELKFEGISFIKKQNKEKQGYEYLVRFDIDKEIKFYTNGLKLLFKLRQTFPSLFLPNKLKSSSVEMFKKVTGTDILFESLIEGNEKKFFNNISSGLEDFLKIRTKYLLYK